MDKVKFATVWLSGCAGCHMSLLDLDEWLVELADKVELVFSPAFADSKEYPEDVDVCLVEGAVGNEEDLHSLRKIRERTKNLVALGACAINSNFTGMRNVYDDAEPVLNRTYVDSVTLNPQLPYDEEGVLPRLLPRVLALHEVVPVDISIAGCPPSADRIKAAIEPLINK